MQENHRKNPYDTYELLLRALNAARIARVRSDHELLRDDWKIYFAIDPYDISQFCFPFSQNSLRQFQTAGIEEMGRLLNGRYEVFYKLPGKPIVLEPYVEELESSVNWAKWSEFVPTKSDLLDKYLNLLRLDIDEKKTLTALKNLKANDISSLIAVVTGMVSIGLDRFQDVVTNRLIRGSPDGPGGPDLSTRTEVVNEVVKVFELYFEDPVRARRPSRPKAGSEKWELRAKDVIRVNNLRDAKAVDQLLQLNEIYNPKKTLILYLSSSPKSLDLFGRRGLPGPIINGQPYDLVRTARDLFMYMVYRGDADSPLEQANSAIEKLKELGELIEDVERIRDRFQKVSAECEHCNRDESLPRCEFGTHCAGVTKQGEHIAMRQEVNINLSLQKELTQALDSARKNQKRINARGGKYGDILDALSDLIKKGNQPKVVNQEMESILQAAVTKMRFVSEFLTSSSSDMGTQVSCYLNYFPVRLRVGDQALNAIVQQVVKMLPKGNWDIEEFRKYVGRYLEIDAAWDVNLESELVRCFLYSIMENDRAIDIAETYLETDERIGDKIVQEFRYLQCFILWHTEDFQKALEIADAGIRNYKSDPRFYHARSIILIALLRKQPHESAYDWSAAVAAATKAIDLFSRTSDREMEAVSYNNLAYSYSSENMAGLDLRRSEQYLNELVKRIPEEKWSPSYPEFFHTKASIFLAKYEVAPATAVLREAHDAASMAFELFPEKEEHAKLKEKIEGHFTERQTRPESHTV